MKKPHYTPTHEMMRRLEATKDINFEFSYDIEQVLIKHGLDKRLNVDAVYLAYYLAMCAESIEVYQCLRDNMLESRKQEEFPSLQTLAKTFGRAAKHIGNFAACDIVTNTCKVDLDLIKNGLRIVPEDKRSEVIRALQEAASLAEDIKQGKEGSYQPPEMPQPPSVTPGMHCDACCAEAVIKGFVRPVSGRGFVYNHDGGVCSRCGVPADVFNHPGMVAFTEQFPMKPPEWDSDAGKWKRREIQ